MDSSLKIMIIRGIDDKVNMDWVWFSLRKALWVKLKRLETREDYI